MKTLIEKLPVEIILEICKYLDFGDIYTLKYVSSELRNKIKSSQHFLITDETKKIERMTRTICSKSHIYVYVQFHITNLFNSFVTFYPFIGSFPDFAIETLCSLTSNVQPVYNTLLRKVLISAFVHGNISLHDEFEIFLLYIFITSSSGHVKLMEYNIRFFDSILKRKRFVVTNLERFVKSYMLQVVNTDIHNRQQIQQLEDAIQEFQILPEFLQSSPQTFYMITFDTLHIISNYITTLPILSRLFGVKKLDLRRTTFIQIPLDQDNEEISCLAHIVRFKFNRPHDMFLSYNYNQLKDLLKEQKVEYFYRIHVLETTLINRFVRYKDPFTKNFITLSSRRSRNLLYRLQYEMPHRTHEYRILCYVIKRQQDQLLRHYFT